MDFCGKFLAKNGLLFLFDLLISIRKESLEKDTLKSKSLTLVLKIIAHCFQIKQFSSYKGNLSNKIIQTLLSETLKIIQSFLMTVKH